MSVTKRATAAGCAACHWRAPKVAGPASTAARTAALKITGLPRSPATCGTSTSVAGGRAPKASIKSRRSCASTSGWSASATIMASAEPSSAARPRRNDTTWSASGSRLCTTRSGRPAGAGRSHRHGGRARPPPPRHPLVPARRAASAAARRRVRSRHFGRLPRREPLPAASSTAARRWGGGGGGGSSGWTVDTAAGPGVRRLNHGTARASPTTRYCRTIHPLTANA